MTREWSYRDYIDNHTFFERYHEYQRKYAEEPRESDKTLARHVGEALAELGDLGRPARLLDIGCSTGNLLRLLKRLFPDLDLTGADLARESVEVCRADPELRGVHFEVMDLLDLKVEAPYDIVVANAVAYCLSHSEYEAAMRSVAHALGSRGTYIAFEWLHPFKQDLVINEKTISHPNGLNIYARPYDVVTPILQRAGFAEIRYHPFELPIDLPPPVDPLGADSRTIRDETGHRLCFRGALYQPWCHLVAVRGSDSV